MGRTCGEPDEIELTAMGVKLNGSRCRSYLQFMRHFQRMTDDLGSRMMSLNSLWFTHYFASTGQIQIRRHRCSGHPNPGVRILAWPHVPIFGKSFELLDGKVSSSTQRQRVSRVC